MPTFFCKLHSPRPDFPMTMSDEEKAIMGRHGAYLQSGMEQGKVHAFGPVGDPAGAWGMALVSFASENEARAFAANDPAVVSGIGLRYEIIPMLALVRPSGRL